MSFDQIFFNQNIGQMSFGQFAFNLKNDQIFFDQISFNPNIDQMSFGQIVFN